MEKLTELYRSADAAGKKLILTAVAALLEHFKAAKTEAKEAKRA